MISEEKTGEHMANVKIHDNGAGFCIMVDGFCVHAENSLGGAWRHIEWMYRIATQHFTVGDNKTPVETWIARMHAAGCLE